MMLRAARYSLFALGLVVYAGLFAEGFLRLFSPQAFMPREVIAAPFGVRMNRPGAVYEQKTPETRAVIRINNEGLRALRDFQMSKPAGVRRIAVFGDSYFLGYESSYADMATTRLEQSLREAGCPVEVLNFSVSGFGTAEMLKTLEAEAISYQPDVVIFEWHHTDPDDNLRANLYALKDGALVETGARYVPAVGLRAALENSSLYRGVAANSHLFIAAREKLSRYIRRAMAGHVFTRKTTEGAEAQERKASATDLALLERAGHDAAGEGAKFYVVDIPGMQSRTRFRSSFRLLPPEIAARPNFISPLDAFEAAASNAGKIYWERGHRHLTPKGNAILAEVIARKLTADAQTRAALACKGAGARLAAVPSP